MVGRVRVTRIANIETTLSAACIERVLHTARIGNDGVGVSKSPGAFGTVQHMRHPLPVPKFFVRRSVFPVSRYLAGGGILNQLIYMFDRLTVFYARSWI
jgi:hypothetical protein